MVEMVSNITISKNTIFWIFHLSLPLPFTNNRTERFLECSDAIIVKVNFMTSNYKEITEVRAYGIQALVGNAGGYVGLFLGFALKEIPKKFFILYRNFRDNTKKLLPL